MSILNLPLPLVQDILCHVVETSQTPISILRLRLVNRLFNREIFKFLARHRLRSIPQYDTLRYTIPEGFKLKLVREHLGDADRPGCSDFVSHMHAVADELQSLITTHPSEETTHVQTRDDMLHEVSKAILRYGYHRTLFGADYKDTEERHNLRCQRCRHQVLPYHPKPQPRIRRKATADDIRRTSDVVAIILGWKTLVKAVWVDNMQPRYFSRPLETAIAMGQAPIVAMLLEQGFSVKHSEEAVIKAVSRGHVEVVRVCSHDSSQWFDASSRPALRILLCAARNDRWEIIRILLDKGLVATEHKRYLLVEAIRANQIELVSGLIVPFNVDGIDVRMQWRHRRFTPLSRAAEWGHFDMVKMLLGKLGKDQPIRQASATLRAAVSGGNVRVMELLYERGIYVTDWAKLWTLACKKGRVEMARWLLEHEPEVGEKYGMCLALGMTQAVVKRRHEMVRFLVQELYVNVNGHARFRKTESTPLWLAVESGDLDMVALLQELGATRMSKRDKEGFHGRLLWGYGALGQYAREQGVSDVMANRRIGDKKMVSKALQMATEG